MAPSLITILTALGGPDKSWTARGPKEGLNAVGDAQEHVHIGNEIEKELQKAAEHGGAQAVFKVCLNCLRPLTRIVASLE